LFKKNAILPSGFRQMVQGTHAHHPTADDHDASMLSHIRIPRLGDPQPLRHKPSAFAVDAAEANPVDAKSRRQPIRKGA
jgi:hypothetical protein